MSTTERGDLSRYSTVAAGTVGHIRTEGFMSIEIQPPVRPVRVLGWALTVSCQPMDNAPVSEALERAEAGDVLVIDRQGDRRHACWGGNLTQAAKVAGLVAVVVDGAVTDWREVTELEFPVFCRSLSALTTRRFVLDGSVGEPIVYGGVHVRSGDLVLGDDDGIVVIPAESAPAGLDEALQRQERDERVRSLLSRGLSLADAPRAASQ